MDNNQMNGMQNNMNPNGVQNQVPVDNGMNQTMAQPAAMPVNNGMAQAMPQQMPVDPGMTQAIPQQMPMDNGMVQPAAMPVNNGMPQAMPQQMPMNGMPQQQMPGAPAPKKSNTGLIILIIVIGVVILGLAGFIGVSLLGGESSNGGDNPEVEEVAPDQEDVNGDDGNVGQVDNSNTQTITHNGYNYNVDKGIVYQVQNGMLLVRNTAGNVQAQMSSAYGSYAQYLASSESLKQELVTAGYGTITYETKKYNNRDYMVFSGTYQNIPFQFFIVGLDSTHVIQGLMITKTGTEWNDGYNMVEDFVSDVNGTGSGETSSSFSVSIPGSNNGTFFQQIK